MFGEEDDGDLDFAPSKDLSRLASIFGSNDQSNTSGSKSLAYTAPKQKMQQPNDLKMSDSSSNLTKTDPNSTVVMAFAVHLFVLVNNQYASQGKVGAALAQNRKSNSSQIVLYRDKQKPLALVDIGPDFTFTLQNGMYGNFEDSRNCHYSLRFDSESIAAKFASQVEAAKEHLKPSPTAAAIVPASTPEPVRSMSPMVSEPVELTCLAPSSSANEVTDKKTSLINRMARMGQPILPMLCRSPSLEAESIAEVREAYSLESPLPAEIVNAKPSQRIELPVSNHAAVWPVSHVPRSEIISLNTLLRDNQSHFAEVKADSSRFMDKLDQLVVKVDTLQQQQILQQQTLQLQFLQNMQQSQAQMCLQPQATAAPKVTTGDPRLEEYLISTENLKLTVERQLEAVYKLIESNSRVQIVSSVDPEEIQRLREEKEQLTIRLNETLEDNKEKEESHRKVLSECQTLFTEKEEHLRQLQEAQDMSRKLQNELDTSQSRSQHQDQETNTDASQMEEYEKTIGELREKLNQSTVGEQSRVNSQVQRIMNTVYRQLLHSFSPEETYDYADIKTTLSSVIREVTSSLLSENSAQAEAGKPDLPPPPVFSSRNDE